MMRAKGKAGDWVAIGDARDLPATARSGAAVSIAATQFSASLMPLKAPAVVDPATARGDVLNTLLRLTRPSGASDASQAGQEGPASMADRLRAFEERLARDKGNPAASPACSVEPPLFVRVPFGPERGQRFDALNDAVLDRLADHSSADIAFSARAERTRRLTAVLNGPGTTYPAQGALEL